MIGIGGNRQLDGSGAEGVAGGSAGEHSAGDQPHAASHFRKGLWLFEHFATVGTQARAQLLRQSSIQSSKAVTCGDRCRQRAQPLAVNLIWPVGLHRPLHQTAPVVCLQQLQPLGTARDDQLDRCLQRGKQLTDPGGLGIASEDRVTAQLQAGGSWPGRSVDQGISDPAFQHRVDDCSQSAFIGVERGEVGVDHQHWSGRWRREQLRPFDAP